MVFPEQAADGVRVRLVRGGLRVKVPGFDLTRPGQDPFQAVQIVRLATDRR